jgi:uncharacterized DUF497 family protein
VRIIWRTAKERLNIAKHELPFGLAEQVFADPLSETPWDRITDDEARWRTLGAVIPAGSFNLLVVVHTFPDPYDAPEFT